MTSETDRAATTPRQSLNWRTLWLLTGAGVLGVVAIIPASLTEQANLLKDFPIPLWVILPIQLVQNAVLIGVAVGLGLWLGRKIGLGAPLIEAWMEGKEIGSRLKGILLPSLILGSAAAILVIALEEVFFARRLPKPSIEVPQAPLWQHLLTGVYGGITEELLMRLGLFTIVAWLLVKVSRKRDGQPSLRILWLANVIVAILFGLGHLPATMLLFPLTPLVIARAIILNGLAGLAFGYLYWTRGLESAMLAHFSGDMILIVSTRLFGT